MKTVFPTGVTIYDPDKAYNQYTLFDGRDGKSYLVDMNRQDVNVWNHSGFPVEMIDPSLTGERGHVFAQKKPDTYQNETLLELDWAGRVVWEWGQKAPDGRAGQTHDLARLANGNTLVLSMRGNAPREISILAVRYQMIFEVSRAGDIVWRWTAAEHLDQFRLGAEGRAFSGATVPGAAPAFSRSTT